MSATDRSKDKFAILAIKNGERSYWTGDDWDASSRSPGPDAAVYTDIEEAYRNLCHLDVADEFKYFDFVRVVRLA